MVLIKHAAVRGRVCPPPQPQETKTSGRRIGATQKKKWDDRDEIWMPFFDRNRTYIKRDSSFSWNGPCPYSLLLVLRRKGSLKKNVEKVVLWWLLRFWPFNCCIYKALGLFKLLLLLVVAAVFPSSRGSTPQPKTPWGVPYQMIAQFHPSYFSFLSILLCCRLDVVVVDVGGDGISLVCCTLTFE